MHPANVRALIATRGLDIPVIITEHCWQPLIPMSPLWRRLQSLTYPWADALTAPNSKILDYFPRSVRKRSVEIPNPVHVSAAESNTGGSLTLPDARNIVSMGRLAQGKRFDLLLEAFAAMPSRQSCFLTVIGEGSLRNELEELAVRSDIADRVKFPGLVKNPWAVLRHADLFVMSSESEGLPMVLLEALACGVPVVSFDCPVGPGDIINHGHDGILVPPLDVDALSREMERLINDETERRRLGANAKKTAERYSLERIMPMWEDLIQNVLDGRLKIGDRRWGRKS
jgi:glycosyltransferase involved in cell wall biosynthesis